MRPTVNYAPSRSDDRRLTKEFRQICPGVGVDGRHLSAPMSHPIFGGYYGVWTGYAADDAIRFSGSSGGVLTALSAWLLESRQASSVRGVGAKNDTPSRSIPVRIVSKAEAIAASGSRYAPVANAAHYNQNDNESVFVGKPCEVYAASRFGDSDEETGPIRLSFFCAGTPSQLATDELIARMGADPATIRSLRYRGNGWPGNFRFEDEFGRFQEISYDDSWGKHLGRNLQWRCKTCVDGTGEFADISVGDYWETDSKGYPTFNDSEGNSIVIARTQRGLRIVQEAAAAGVLTLADGEIGALMDIQPLQRIRRATMAGRLAGRFFGGRKVPLYRGFGLLSLALSSVRQNTRAAVGTFLRTIRSE